MFASDLGASFCSTFKGAGTMETVGAASPHPQFEAVGAVPYNGEPEQRSYYFLYFRFVFIGEKAEG